MKDKITDILVASKWWGLAKSAMDIGEGQDTVEALLKLLEVK